MTPVLSELQDTCAICGDVCSERDLLWVDTGDELPGLDAGDLVCRECAPNSEEERRARWLT